MVPSTAASISFVLLLPELPVTDTTRTGSIFRYPRAICCKAFWVSGTKRMEKPTGTFPTSCFCTMAAIAPLSAASAK